MTFSQCVHGVYDEKMEAVYQKYSQNDSFRKTPRVHSHMLLCSLHILYRMLQFYIRSIGTILKSDLR